MPRYPNVDASLSVRHPQRCGVPIDAPGARVPIETLRHISLHANLGASPLLVSLGCEKLQPARLLGAQLPILGEDHVIRLQDHRGFADVVSVIMEAAEKRLAE